MVAATAVRTAPQRRRIRRRRSVAVDGPDPIDVHIGAQIVRRRKVSGISGTELGRRVRISGSQVYKYETGVNRLSPEMLVRLSGALEVPVAFFFAGFGGPQEQPELTETDQEIRSLVTTYRRIANPDSRAAVRAVARAFVSPEADEQPS